MRFPTIVLTVLVVLGGCTRAKREAPAAGLAFSVRSGLERSVTAVHPASDVKPIKMPTLTTRWPEDDLRQLLCQEHFRDADGWSGNRPTEGSCSHEGTSAWATFRPSAAILVSC